MSPESEREFFRLAAVWLDCRLKLLRANTSKDRMWYFLGEIDYHTEMAIMIREARTGRSLRIPQIKDDSGRVPRLVEVLPGTSEHGNGEKS